MILLLFEFSFSIIYMQSRHIWLQNTNQASSCFSKFRWCSQKVHISLWLCIFLTRKHYFNFLESVAIYFLYYIIHVTYFHISLENTNQASCFFSNIWWCSRSPYESLALCLLTSKHYFRFWKPVAVLVLILNYTHDI